MSENKTKVLQFKLSDENYCVNIDNVTEIVKTKELTNIPNSPEEVKGVMDLRGNVTTIINPKQIFDIKNDGYNSEFVIVFDTNTNNKNKG